MCSIVEEYASKKAEEARREAEEARLAETQAKKEATHAKVFGWVSFGVATAISIAALVISIMSM